MNIIKYLSEKEVNNTMAHNKPMLAVISFDGKTAIISHIDDAMEHHILLVNYQPPKGGWLVTIRRY